jgi:hypothetical protein
MRVLPLNTSTKIVTASYQFFNMNKLWNLAILRDEPNMLLYCTVHYVSLFLENKAKKTQMSSVEKSRVQNEKLNTDSKYYFFTLMYTDKKENQIFLIYKEIQSGADAIYVRKGFLIYEEMHKYFPIYEEAGCHICLCNCSTLNFIIYEENLDPQKMWA